MEKPNFIICLISATYGQEFTKELTPVICWVSKVQTGDYLLETMHCKQTSSCQQVNW